MTRGAGMKKQTTKTTCMHTMRMHRKTMAHNPHRYPCLTTPKQASQSRRLVSVVSWPFTCRMLSPRVMRSSTHRRICSGRCRFIRLRISSARVLFQRSTCTNSQVPFSMVCDLTSKRRLKWFSTCKTKLMSRRAVLDTCDANQ